MHVCTSLQFLGLVSRIVTNVCCVVNGDFRQVFICDYVCFLKARIFFATVDAHCRENGRRKIALSLGGGKRKVDCIVRKGPGKR
jgi:hypothetical protein